MNWMASALVCFAMIGMTACRSHLNLEEGMTNFKIQNYRSAFIYLMPEAEKGQPDAQYAIGFMYYYGEGVLEDKKKALLWIKRAAKKGQPQAIKAIRLLRKDYVREEELIENPSLRK